MGTIKVASALERRFVTGDTNDGEAVGEAVIKLRRSRPGAKRQAKPTRRNRRHLLPHRRTGARRSRSHPEAQARRRGASASMAIMSKQVDRDLDVIRSLAQVV